MRLDGWQQAFIVPAGAGGTITMTFQPTATYHLALVVSILAVALLLAIAAWSFTPARRRAAAPSVGPMDVTPYRFLPVESDIHWLAAGARTARMRRSGCVG